MSVRLKADHLQASVSGNILILLTNGLFEFFDFHGACARSQIFGRDHVSLKGMQGMQQSNREAARGSHAGFRGQLRHGNDFQPVAQVQPFQAFAHDRMLDLLHRIPQLGARIADTERISEPLHDGDVHVLVNGRGQHASRLQAIECLHVRAAAGETDPKRGARNDHETNRCWIASSRSGVPIS